MTMPTPMRKHRPRMPMYVTKEVEVEVDGEDVEDAMRDEGWHPKSECRASQPPTVVPIVEAIRSLHRQAHPSQSAEPAVCREEPCRSLTLAQLETGR